MIKRVKPLEQGRVKFKSTGVKIKGHHPRPPGIHLIDRKLRAVNRVGRHHPAMSWNFGDGIPSADDVFP